MDGMGYGLPCVFFCRFGVRFGGFSTVEPTRASCVERRWGPKWIHLPVVLRGKNWKNNLKPKHHPSLDRWLVLGWSEHCSLLTGKKGKKRGQDGMIFSRIGGFKQTDQCRAKQKGECVKHAHLLIQHPLEVMQAPPLKRFPLDPFNERIFWGGSGFAKNGIPKIWWNLIVGRWYISF